MRDYKKLIGGVIRSYRGLKGYSEERVSFMVGVKQQQISKYETGDSAMYVHRMMELSEALEIPMEIFINLPETDDLVVKIENELKPHKELFDIIKANPELTDIINFYGENSSNLKDVDFVDIMKKLAEMSKKERKTAIDSVNKLLR